jgi:hypothetical protein
VIRETEYAAHREQMSMREHVSALTAGQPQFPLIEMVSWLPEVQHVRVRILMVPNLLQTLIAGTTVLRIDLVL